MVYPESPAQCLRCHCAANWERKQLPNCLNPSALSFGMVIVHEGTPWDILWLFYSPLSSRNNRFQKRERPFGTFLLYFLCMVTITHLEERT
jgi:hypothetical protein